MKLNDSQREQLLRRAADNYYNHGNQEEGAITDEQYDALWKEHLCARTFDPEAEVWKDTILDRVGPLSSSSLFAKVEHAVPMLSLDNVFVGEDDSLSELVSWISGVAEKTRDPELEEEAGPLVIVLEPKVDGFSVRVTYVDGRLRSVVSRGDGQVGDDLTINAVQAGLVPTCLYGPDAGLPNRIGDGPPDWLVGQLIVSGEVYMTFRDFRLLNEARKAAGEGQFANPRNAAAGSIRLHDPVEVKNRCLRFVGHDVIFGPSSSYRESVARLRDRGLSFCRAIGISREKALLEERLLVRGSELRSEAEALVDYPIDGVVAKVDQAVYRQRLGSTSRAPRWAIALKFQQEEAVTILREITVQVGRSGILTPVAELEPVELDGSTVSRATLHNQDHVNRLGVNPGDRVVIRKAGAIIPEVVRLHERGLVGPDGDKGKLAAASRELEAIVECIHRNGGKIPEGLNVYKSVGQVVGMDQDDPRLKGLVYQASFCFQEGQYHLGSSLGFTCPSCGEQSVVGVFDLKATKWYCTNGEECPAQRVAKVEHFTGRVSGLGVHGLGTEAVTALVASRKVWDPLDILDLTVEDLAGLSWVTPAGGKMTLGKSRAQKIVKAIGKAKSQPLRKWISALGIPHIGVNTSREVARLVSSPEELWNAATQQGGVFCRMLDDYDGVKGQYRISHHLGPVSVQSLVDYVRANGPVLDEMALLGVVSDNYDPEPEPVDDSLPLSGKTLVITGTLSAPRAEIKELIERGGGKLSGSISKGTDYLVAGEKAGSKLDKAARLGVEVLSERQLRAKLS